MAVDLPRQLCYTLAKVTVQMGLFLTAEGDKGGPQTGGSGVKSRAPRSYKEKLCALRVLGGEIKRTPERLLAELGQ